MGYHEIQDHLEVINDVVQREGKFGRHVSKWCPSREQTGKNEFCLWMMKR